MEEMNKLIIEKVIRKTLEVTILKNGQLDLSLFGEQYIQPSCKFSLGGRSRTYASPLNTPTTRVGALMAHNLAWVSHHTGGSWSTPTAHPCSGKVGGCG